MSRIKNPNHLCAHGNKHGFVVIISQYKSSIHIQKLFQLSAEGRERMKIMWTPLLSTLPCLRNYRDIRPFILPVLIIIKVIKKGSRKIYNKKRNLF